MEESGVSPKSQQKKGELACFPAQLRSEVSNACCAFASVPRYFIVLIFLGGGDFKLAGGLRKQTEVQEARLFEDTAGRRPLASNSEPDFGYSLLQVNAVCTTAAWPTGSRGACCVDIVVVAQRTKLFSASLCTFGPSCSFLSQVRDTAAMNPRRWVQNGHTAAISDSEQGKRWPEGDAKVA